MKTFIFTVITATILLFSSCATKTKIEYRDRDVNHYITNTVHDTLIEKSTDSIFQEIKVSGDTVFVTKYKLQTKWRDRVAYKDSVVRDSIIVNNYKEEIKEVTKIPKIYTIAFIIAIIIIILAGIKIWLKIRQTII